MSKLIANTMFFRVTEQKTPSGRSVGFHVLGGFDAKLTYATAAYRETGSNDMTSGDVQSKVAKMQAHANAECVEDCTSKGPAKKIAQNDERLACAFG